MLDVANIDVCETTSNVPDSDGLCRKLFLNFYNDCEATDKENFQYGYFQTTWPTETAWREARDYVK